MKIVKFILAFVGTGIVLFALVIGWNWKSFEIFLNNREAFEEGSEWVPKTQSLRGLTEYIDENSDKVSVASIVLEHPDSTLFIKEETPRTLGTISNLFLLTAYAIEMDDGRLDPNERIQVDEIENYQLPQINRTLHTDGLRFASNRGWLNGDGIPLHRALELLVHFNDPALADYLWMKLQPFNWNDFKKRHNLVKTEMPLPFSGLYIYLSAHEENRDIADLIDERNNLSEDNYRQLIFEKAERFQADSIFRNEIINRFEDDRLGRSFMQERDALNLFPRGTAKELAYFLQDLWNRENISDAAAKQIFDWLQSPYIGRSEIERDFTHYGALFDNRIGLLNGIDFGTLIYTGETKFQAIIFDQLQVGFWFHMSGNHMHQDFQQRLIYDPALIELMEKVADNHPNSDSN